MVANNPSVEPKTTYTISVRVSTITTAGKTKNDRGYYDIEVPSRGPDTVLEWNSTAESLDGLIDTAHHMLKLYGGTVGLIIDAPHDRGVMEQS